MIDLVWMGKGWRFLVPTFQAALDRTLAKETPAKLRIASRTADDKLDLASLAGANILIPTMEQCAERELAAAGETLKLVFQPASGIDNISKEACKRAGVPFCNAPGQNYVDTAEGTVMLLLALARKLPEGLLNVQKRVLGGPTGSALYGKTIGIVGSGLIGSEVARMCEQGFRMNTISVDRKSTPREMEELLQRSDIISMHCPLTPETEGMIGSAEIERMKPGVLIVNTARGKLIKKDALRVGLESGKVGGFACDVFWEEPADPADPFLQLPNVIITPHVCSSTHEFFNRIAELCAKNTQLVMRGEFDELPHRVV